MAVGFQNSILSGSLNVSGSYNLPTIGDLTTSGELGEIAVYNEVPYVFTSTGWVSIGDNNTVASIDLEYLVVAGGGGGGGTIAGGGGAGGLLSSSFSSITPGSTYTITVGAGGTGGYGWGTYTAATQGGTSSISGDGITTVTSTGGGKGGDHYGNSSTSNLPGDGGSGGGGGRSTSYPQAGGSSVSGQGNDGGSIESENAGNTGKNFGSGGGGATAAGETAGADADGGAGKASSITGTSTNYAGGGGGGARQSYGTDVGEGGSGGGGAGGTANSATAGTANTGGGGGGAGYTGTSSNKTGGDGGSGVVILAYNSSSMNAIGGQEGDAGNGRKYHKFNSSGTLYTGDTTDFQIVTDNLYAHYDLANTDSYPGTGTTITDLKGSNNLTIVSAPPFVTDNGGGLDFDGSADYAEKTSISYTPHVMDIWFNNHDSIGTGVMQGNYQTLASFGAYPFGFNLGAWTSVATNETVNMYTNATAGVVYIRDTIAAGVHNMVWRWSGTAWKCYIDGVEKTVYGGGSSPQQLRAGTGISMGRGQGGNSYEFDGHIYEMRIYTAGLTDAQITQNYNARKDKFGL